MSTWTFDRLVLQLSVASYGTPGSSRFTQVFTICVVLGELYLPPRDSLIQLLDVSALPVTKLGGSELLQSLCGADTK